MRRIAAPSQRTTMLPKLRASSGMRAALRAHDLHDLAQHLIGELVHTTIDADTDRDRRLDIPADGLAVHPTQPGHRTQRLTPQPQTKNLTNLEHRNLPKRHRRLSDRQQERRCSPVTAPNRRTPRVVPSLAARWSHHTGGTHLKVVPSNWRATRAAAGHEAIFADDHPAVLVYDGRRDGAGVAVLGHDHEGTRCVCCRRSHQQSPDHLQSLCSTPARLSHSGSPSARTPADTVRLPPSIPSGLPRPDRRDPGGSAAAPEGLISSTTSGSILNQGRHRMPATAVSRCNLHLYTQ